MSNNKQTTPEVNPSKRFLALAELLLEIMIEGNEGEGLPNNFKMPKAAINKTAIELETAFNKGEFEEDENKMLYYSGMTEDYGGNYEAEFEKAKTVKHTPLPWRVRNFRRSGKDDYNIIGGDKYTPIAHVYGGADYDYKFDESGIRINAAFIVHACNNHYQLLEACKHLVKIIEKENEAFYNKHIEAFNIGIETIKNAEQ